MKLAALFFLIFVAACHKAAEKPEEISAPVVEQKSAPVKPLEIKPKISKTLREAVYFSASLEREALKLLVKDSSFQRNTLFSVLSYTFETFSGVKKSTPLGLDCGKFQLQILKDQMFVEKACQKPFREVARINILSEDREFEFTFKVAEWGRVLGLSAALTGSDIKCRISVVDQKLSLLKCDNWFYQVSEDQMSSTVIKTTEFTFQRSAEKQFVIRGGYYKELIQNKKIDIVVPLEGKIKIIEKELKVIDEFADQKDGVIHEKKDRVEIKPIEEGKSLEEIKAAKEGRPVEEVSAEQEGQKQEVSSEEGQPQITEEQNSGAQTVEGENGQVFNPTSEGQTNEPEPEPTPAPVPPPRSRGR